MVLALVALVALVTLVQPVFGDCPPTYQVDENGAFRVPHGTTVIAQSAYAGCPNITSVTMPNTVWGISPGAFLDCINLESVIVADSVTAIGIFAFALCDKLNHVVLSSRLTDIHNNAFSDNPSLESIVIPNSVTRIGYQAFHSNSNLSTIQMPDGPGLIIGPEAFTNASCDEALYVEGASLCDCLPCPSSEDTSGSSGKLADDEFLVVVICGSIAVVVGCALLVWRLGSLRRPVHDVEIVSANPPHVYHHYEG